MKTQFKYNICTCRAKSLALMCQILSDLNTTFVHVEHKGNFCLKVNIKDLNTTFVHVEPVEGLLNIAEAAI